MPLHAPQIHLSNRDRREEKEKGKGKKKKNGITRWGMVQTFNTLLQVSKVTFVHSMKRWGGKGKFYLKNKIFLFYSKILKLEFWSTQRKEEGIEKIKIRSNSSFFKCIDKIVFTIWINFFFLYKQFKFESKRDEEKEKMIHIMTTRDKSPVSCFIQYNMDIIYGIILIYIFFFFFLYI